MKSPVIIVRNVIEAAYYWLRRVLGLAYSLLMRDTLTSLRQETEQLSSAAVESAAYVGAELRAIDQRLAKLEEELETLCELLEERAPAERSRD
jgi:Tfp pilus assembly protein PilO